MLTFEYITLFYSGPVLALGLARDDAIQGWRNMLGPKEVPQAKEEAPERYSDPLTLVIPLVAFLFFYALYIQIFLTYIFFLPSMVHEATVRCYHFTQFYI